MIRIALNGPMNIDPKRGEICLWSDSGTSRSTFYTVLMEQWVSIQELSVTLFVLQLWEIPAMMKRDETTPFPLREYFFLKPTLARPSL